MRNLIRDLQYKKLDLKMSFLISWVLAILLLTTGSSISKASNTWTLIKDHEGVQIFARTTNCQGVQNNLELRVENNNALNIYFDAEIIIEKNGEPFGGMPLSFTINANQSLESTCNVQQIQGLIAFAVDDLNDINVDVKNSMIIQ